MTAVWLHSKQGFRGDEFVSLSSVGGPFPSFVESCTDVICMKQKKGVDIERISLEVAERYWSNRHGFHHCFVSSSECS